MTRWGRRWGSAVLLVLPLVLAAGCGGTDGTGATVPAADDGTAAGPGATAAATPAYRLPPCPALPRRAPVPGGLPALELPCLGAGPAVRLSDLRGEPTVLSVWAAWCTNCDREMPLFADAVRRADDRVRFFGVHYKAPAAFGRRSAADFGVPFPSVHDDDGDRTVLALKAGAPPQTLFYAADGTLAGRHPGEIRSVDELDALVQRYLGVAL